VGHYSTRPALIFSFICFATGWFIIHDCDKWALGSDTFGCLVNCPPVLRAANHTTEVLSKWTNSEVREVELQLRTATANCKPCGEAQFGAISRRP
jgi:hypothetical protein